MRRITTAMLESSSVSWYRVLPAAPPQSGEPAWPVPETPHQRPRLLEVPEQLVHVAHPGAAARGDPAPPAAVDHPRRAPLLLRHAEQDGLVAPQLRGVGLRLLQSRRAHPGQHLHQILDGPHLLHLPELLEEVVQ